VTLDEMKALPPAQQKALYKRIAASRKVYKQVNYSCVYGAGGATVGRSAGVSTSKGEKLVAAYWERNWSVKAIAEDCTVKRCNGMKWLYNPVSGFWYSLRHEKDRFSTLNQGTGVYCFDMWVKKVKSKGLPIIGQMHDEIIGLVKKGVRERATSVCKWAVGEINKELKLNRELDVDVQFGSSYAEIH
jgi:DNA polymerase I-like protein with 3'-5' exonuclease and polymerase domains